MRWKYRWIIDEIFSERQHQGEVVQSDDTKEAVEKEGEIWENWNFDSSWDCGPYCAGEMAVDLLIQFLLHAKIQVRVALRPLEWDVQRSCGVFSTTSPPKCSVFAPLQPWATCFMPAPKSPFLTEANYTLEPSEKMWSGKKWQYPFQERSVRNASA